MPNHQTAPTFCQLPKQCSPFWTFPPVVNLTPITNVSTFFSSQCGGSLALLQWGLNPIYWLQLWALWANNLQHSLFLFPHSWVDQKLAGPLNVWLSWKCFFAHSTFPSLPIPFTLLSSPNIYIDICVCIYIFILFYFFWEKIQSIVRSVMSQLCNRGQP